MDIAGNSAGEFLDNSGRIVAMAAAARQLHSKLKAYGSVETKPEFLEQMLDMVDELKRCCISPEDLKLAMRETEGALTQKLEELSLLLESYDALCSRGKRDPRDLMSWVLEQLEQIDFASRHVFYVDGFPDFTIQNLSILEHIIVSSPEVTISINCDQLKSEHMAFEKPGETAYQLYEIAKRNDIPVQVQFCDPRHDALTPMREKLFQGNTDMIPHLQGVVRAVKAGSVYQDKNETLTQQRFTVPVKDTTAAGDTFLGYFVKEVSQDTPDVAKALQVASMAAALAVSREGAMPSVPLRSEVEAALAAL
jgi:hypothetical protein